jgi:hypothetical protein
MNTTLEEVATVSQETRGRGRDWTGQEWDVFAEGVGQSIGE